MAQWYYGSSAGQHGPVDENELRAMIASGGVGPLTLVWREGMSDWMPLQNVPDFGIQQPAPYLPPYGGPLGYYPGAPVPNSGLAIASMVCGIAGYLTCYFVGILGIPAVICGHMALNRINSSPVPVAGRGMAIAGLILGYLGILITVGTILFFVFAFVASGSP
ncbi:MAG: hypothetical protein B9S38_08790 [Verrucomicrobiia bacterium Tous-C4TDCM]|nr:MAG: hypothetical protein B9S38_08790 [Verrucomicrobiae bacterium Tous-C4TDCM]